MGITNVLGDANSGHSSSGPPIFFAFNASALLLPLVKHSARHGQSTFTFTLHSGFETILGDLFSIFLTSSLNFPAATSFQVTSFLD
jgi:hypothetical protein